MMIKIFDENFHYKFKSVHKRITVFSKQEQGINKQIFVVELLISNFENLFTDFCVLYIF